ncbi:MAG: hypothetical protein GVY24_07100 [Planctomycetes bacterium]|nr:hypothetical protein [Planctomycetota bacterium]
MDLKIEIRKLYALHEATIQYDHAVRTMNQLTWSEFAPSRFIYAFFTFNSIYSYNWKSSFCKEKAIKWDADSTTPSPRESKRFKEYLRFADQKMNSGILQHFSEELMRRLQSYGIDKPIDELQNVCLVNATKDLRNLAEQLPGQFKSLLEPKPTSTDFYSPASAVLAFVYEVRCNLFHGSKTRVQLHDHAQQRRLLIYTAILIAANSLLFQVAKTAKIGWMPVDVELTPQTTADEPQPAALIDPSG